MDKITIIPGSVRGYGDVVSPKTLEDFEVFDSELSFEDGLYTLVYDASGVSVGLSVSSSSITVGGSVVLTAEVLSAGEPAVGETVSFYDGSTLLGTDETDSDGIATYTASSLGVGSHSLTAEALDESSSAVTVTVNKIASTISLSASSGTITYGDSVTLSGTLSVGSGESVKIYQGSTLLESVTTGTGGAFTKTITDLGVGSYTFKAVYDGDSTHTGVTSSNVSVTVNKLTSTITLSVPASGTVGTSYSITGTLVPTSGSVKLYENSVLKDTLTVTSGSFSKSITQSNEGTYSYYAVFEGSSTYSSVTSSTGSIVVSDVPTPTVDSVSLTGDKSILSYADSESATLSATVLDSNDDPMSGVTVEFFKGSTSLGTADTNSSGVATKSYASSGSGDVSFTAVVGTISSETYTIEDCIRYDTTTRNLAPNSSLSQIDSFSFTNTGDWEVEWIMNLPAGKSRVVLYNPSNANVFLGIGASENSNRVIYWYGHEEKYSTFSYNTDYTMKIEKDGSNFKIYSQNTLLITMTYSDLLNTSTINLGLRNWGSGTGTIRNVKIKPL